MHFDIVTETNSWDEVTSASQLASILMGPTAKFSRQFSRTNAMIFAYWSTEIVMNTFKNVVMFKSKLVCRSQVYLPKASDTSFEHSRPFSSMYWVIHSGCILIESHSKCCRKIDTCVYNCYRASSISIREICFFKIIV